MKTRVLLIALLVPAFLNAQVFDSSTEATKVSTNYGL